MKIVITGAGGLIGFHASVRLHAVACSANFKGECAQNEVVHLDRAGFCDDDTLCAAISGADAVLHFAGVNRGSDTEVETGNSEIARRLVAACTATDSLPHIVYANSTHAIKDSPYGNSKRLAGDVLEALGGRYTNLILPHVFGECARPRYNNVTATFIEAVITGKVPEVNSNGQVELLHAGAAAQAAIDAIQGSRTGLIRPAGRSTLVPELLERLQSFHVNYNANIFPDLEDPFDLELFNSYRAALYPGGFPRPLKTNTDARGTLFEAVKGGGGGQTFLSTTAPGITRGNHFHLRKVERFLVVQGEAIIRIRRVLSNDVWEYRVSGNHPAPVDMPSLYTHSIENVSSTPLLTLFWTHDLFDPASPDTYFDPVLRAQG
jgi:UDP-2-acetamido-2,6-beta-L-arabino-hexul-4-ose reductase